MLLFYKELQITEKHLDNTIYIRYIVTERYKKAHSLTNMQFLELDDKYHIIDFVGECPDIFDSMSEEEMIEEISMSQIISNILYHGSTEHIQKINVLKGRNYKDFGKDFTAR